MKFKTASAVESLCQQMRLSDWPRARNRAKIEELFNGFPPFLDEEAGNGCNVNFLDAPVLGHGARKNFYNAILKPGSFFKVKLDSGPVHKRDLWSSTITQNINRPMKRSLQYFEVWRSNIGANVLHGIAPKVWSDRYSWRPDAVAPGDVLIPSSTLLTMENLPFFAIYRRYTAFQLMQMTSASKRDPGWKMPAVKAAIKWADNEATQLSGTQWPDTWSPERMAERIKEDSGLYASDAVPTIDCYDFYYWDRVNKEDGWRRRIVWDQNGAIGTGGQPTTEPKKGQTTDFLYDPGDRVFAQKREEIIAFQFADLSATSPFRYHSVRGLGYLLFAICNLQNRLLCKFNDALFEHFLQYFRVSSDEDVGRAVKLNLLDKGLIDKSVQFVKSDERWKIDKQLAEMGIEMNREMMGRNSASMVEEAGSGRDEHMKATVYMGKMQQANALVGAALQQSYTYSEWEYREMARRFCQPNSKDPDVRKFRVLCLKAGVPQEMLDPDRWDIAAEQVMGGGNQMLEQSIAQQLMQFRPLFDPDAQRTILRKATLAITSDPDLSNELVPEQAARVTNTVADAQRAAASLYLGLHVDPRPGENHQEVAKTIIGEMALIVKRVESTGGANGGVAKPAELQGLQTMAQYAGQQIQMLAQDEQAGPVVKVLQKDLQALMKIVQGYAQKLQQMMQERAKQNGNGADPKEAAKAQAMVIEAQNKAALDRESHAQRTAERATQNEIKLSQDAQRHQQDLEQRGQQHVLELATQAERDKLALEQEKAKAAEAKKAKTKTVQE